MSKGMGSTVWNGNCIIDKMYPNKFESVGLIRNGRNMGYPQLLTPIQKYNTDVVVIIIVSYLFDVWGQMQFFDFTWPPKPKGWSTMSVATYSVNCDSLCWWQRKKQMRNLVQMARKDGSERINDKTNLKPLLLICT